MNGHDSVVDLLSNGSSTTHHHHYPLPPSYPKPTSRKTTRRASSVTSPYRRPSHAPNKVSSSSSSLSYSFNGTQGHTKRKSLGSIDLSSTDHSGKNVLDLRDELNRVCKTLRETTTEKQELNYEILRLKKVLDKKEKEVEDLLMGGYVGQKDKTRMAGASSKQDTLMVFSSLKHRIHTLERNLRHKEEELGTLRRDIRTTKLKELETEKEIYYTEIKRLQDIADRLRLEMNDEVPQSKKHMRKKIEEQTQTIKQLKERGSIMYSDLVKYKETLGLWRNGKATIDKDDTDERKCLFSKYVKLKQGELITRLMDSEEKTQTIEAEMKSLKQKHINETRKYERKISSDSEEILGLQKRLAETESMLNDVRVENSSLQDSCTHYKEKIEKARMDLSVTTENLNTLREKQLASDNAIQSEQQAALTIQKSWKHRLSDKKQKAFDQDNNMIVTSIQSILRGHVARRQLVKQADEDCVRLLQNIIRGHRTREKF